MSVSIDLVTQIDQLTDETIHSWNELAPHPFLRWEWLGPWAQSYRDSYRPLILLFRRDQQLVGVAPWCVENRLSIGRTLQFMGSGKACTDHLTVLVQPADRTDVCRAAAGWLSRVQSSNDLPSALIWDAIEWVGIDADDSNINALVEAMGAEGLQVSRTEGLGCYGIDLPNSWEDYVQQRSKSGRREIRQSLKSIDDGSIVLHHIHDQRELEEYWDAFVQLHQRRRHAAGTTGCFDHPPFGDFLRHAAAELLKSDLLKMAVATKDGQPIAAQFAVVGSDVWYYYQSGMDPDAAALRPGLGLFCSAIRETIETGRQRFDMMRGDEPYKRRWRAELQPTQEIRVCSPRAAAQVRNKVFSATRSLKHLVESGIGRGSQH